MGRKSGRDSYIARHIDGLALLEPSTESQVESGASGMDCGTLGAEFSSCEENTPSCEENTPHTGWGASLTASLREPERGFRRYFLLLRCERQS